MLIPGAMVLGLLCIGLVAAGVTQRRTALPDHADRGVRHDRMVHVLALVVALLSAVLGALWAMESPTVGGGLAIPLAATYGAGLGYVAVQAAGQLVWPRPAGEHRRAALVPRGVADVTGPWVRPLLAIPLAVLATAVVAPAVFAPLDGPSAGARDVYRAGWDQPPGAVVTLRHVLGLGWPGLRYGLPVVVATGLLLGLAVVALRAVADRSRVADVDADVDQEARRTVARRIACVTAGVLTVSGGWLVLAAGSRLVETGTGMTVRAGVLLLAVGTMWAAAGVLVAVLGVVWPAARRVAGPTMAVSRA